LFNKTILDLPESTNDLIPSEYLLFVKDTSYEDDLNNKLTLIIINKANGYVVNNNFKFNSIEIDNKINIYTIINNKRQKSEYLFKYFLFYVFLFKFVLLKYCLTKN
jgi:GTPase involved in cell partitioning and DNA repair